jgi:anti-sigma-K factor RskA
MSEEERRLDELLGAYALDAVSEDERREVEEYLAIDPRARAEVEDHREIATMLAWTGVPAPDGLWERIAERLDDTAPAPSGELAAVLAMDAAPSRARRRSFARNVGAWAAATAAAAAVAVLAVNVVQRNDRDDTSIQALADAALHDRDSEVAMLVSADGTVGGQAVIDQDGHGYLIAGDLPSLTNDRTYQLWGVIDGEAISLGVLGAAPEVESFTADGPITQLVITNEVAGGVISNGNMQGAFSGIIG